MIKNVILCGLGAVGCVYANKISKCAQTDLRILVDETRLDKYTKNPMMLNGKPLNLKYILPNVSDFIADLIIITTKFDGLESAIKNIKNFVGDNTVILSLLNGVTSENLIANVYGKDKVLFSYWIGHSAMREGNNVIHDGVGTIVFGSKDFRNDRVNLVREFFENAGIEYEIPDDIEYKLWLKFMLNVSTNQPSAIYKTTFGEMQDNPEIMQLVTNLMKEVQSVAKAEGVKNTQIMIDEALKTLKTMTPEGKTSMLQDVLAKRKTEVNMFAGTIIELGKKYNILTPYNEMMKERIEEIEENR